MRSVADQEPPVEKETSQVKVERLNTWTMKPFFAAQGAGGARTRRSAVPAVGSECHALGLKARRHLGALCQARAFPLELHLEGERRGKGAGGHEMN